MDRALTDYLSQFITDSKYEKIVAIARARTRYVTLVLEELYQTQNTSACLRSAECFGIQDVHVVDHTKTFCVSAPIAKGAAQWLTVKKHSSIQTCYETLRADGYTIVATTPRQGALTLDQISVDAKIAFVFGSEQHGLSQEAMAAADEYLAIPMVGFTQSLNVSVAVGLCLHEIISRVHISDVAWQLSPQEQQELIHLWICKALPYADKLERAFLKNQHI